MTRLKTAVVAVLATLVLCFGSLPAQAQSEMTFQVRSNHPNKVQIKFYSQDRKGHQWPNSTNAYNLDDSQVHSYRIGCLGGEKVCYGAWVTGNSNTYWGVGYNNSQRCSNCCYTCSGGTTQVINLNR